MAKCILSLLIIFRIFEIHVLTKITTKQIIHCVKKHFALYGIPKVIVSDCGSQFISHNFSALYKKWHITHITSSPGHQQENGKTEAVVWASIKNNYTNHKDQYLAFLELRNTPRQDINVSPFFIWPTNKIGNTKVD